MMYILPSEEAEEADALLEGAVAGAAEELDAGDGLPPLPGEGLGELPDPDDPEEEEEADDDELVLLPCACQQPKGVIEIPDD